MTKQTQPHMMLLVEQMDCEVCLNMVMLVLMPVAQFMPMTSMGRLSRAVNALAMSLPASIWPVVSTVTCAAI